MKGKVLAEILAAHADGLNEGRDERGACLTLFPEYDEDLKPLLDIAEMLKEELGPVEPSPAFRRALHRELMHRARQRATMTPQRKGLSRLVLGMTALFSVLAGLAYLLRMRIRHHPSSA